MKQRSWMILAVCLLLGCALFAVFLITRSSAPQLTQEEAIDVTRKVEFAFRHKNANGILMYIAPLPDTRIANINPDQLHVLLVRYFRNSDRVGADMSHYVFASTDSDATLQFDLVVHNDGADSRKEDYSGHITLHLRRVEVPQMLGLYQTKEWRIVGAETTGPDLSSFGD